jgi:hypothetical protein
VVASSAARSARSGQEACDAIDRVVQALAVARHERVDGLVARASEDTRRGVDQAFPEYEQAVTTYRRGAIRAFVDECGMTLSEAARTTGVSRQMVGRLYRGSG